MQNRFILQIIACVLGLWLATKIVPGVSLEIIPGESQFFGITFTERWQIFLLAGLILGFVNSFIKPVLKIVTLPLRILTFGIFGLIINMIIVWVIDILFPELIIQGLLSLFWTTVIIWGTSTLLGIHRLREKF